MDETESRFALLERIKAERAAGAAPDSADLPPPPYHVRDVEMLYLMCRFDPEAVAAIVPDGLTPSGNGWGVIAMYSVPRGWGIAPYSGFFMAVELKGLDSNDGSPGMYMHSGFYSGVGGQVMQTIYNRNFKIGWSRNHKGGDRITTEAGIGDTTYVRMSADIASGPKPMVGISRYIGRRDGGGFNSYSVAFDLEAQDARPHSIEYLGGSSELVHPLHPLEYVWPIYVPRMSMAFTPPRPIGSAGEYLASDAHNVGVVKIFSSMGRAAAIVERDGALASLNGDAEALIASGVLRISEGRLTPTGSAEVSAFRRLLDGAGPGVGQIVSERVALPTVDGPALIAQAIVLDPSVAGPNKLLVFFDDPARDYATDPGPALQLLGLTPAEARIARLVGAGHAPRAVADELELTLNTVRSAMKIVFDKLGISRQSELAKIVARLAG